MRILLAVIKKEFQQLFRNRLLLFLLLVSPFVILGLIPPAFENLVSIRMLVVDQDDTSVSRLLTSTLIASPYFESVKSKPSISEAMKKIDYAEADMAIVIPVGFEKMRTLGRPIPLNILVDGTHTLSAGDHLYYLSETLDTHFSLHGFAFDVKMFFNRHFAGKNYFLVSLIILLITLLGVSFASISVVNEKERGILDQLEVTPLNRFTYLAGKLIPFLLVSLFEFLLSLGFCYFFYSLEVDGKIADLLLLTVLYLLSVLGLGLLISIVSNNQVQSMYLIIFILLTLILMSTMFSLLSSMPLWAQQLRYINPIYFMLEGARSVILKGTPLTGVYSQIGALTCMALASNGISVFLLYIKSKR